MATLGATLSSVTYPADDQTITSRMVALTDSLQSVNPSETTTSVTYANLATTGPSTVLSSGVTQDRLLFLSMDAYLHSATTSLEIYSVSIAGVAADDSLTVRSTSLTQVGGSGAPRIITAEPSGSTNLTKYRVTAGTGTYGGRNINEIAI